MKENFRAVFTMELPWKEFVRCFGEAWKAGENTFIIDGKEYSAVSIEGDGVNSAIVKFSEIEPSEHELQLKGIRGS